MRLQARVILDLARSPEAIFDYITAPDAFPEVFRGYGPVPAIERMELEEGASLLAVGVMRKAYGADGSIIREKIMRLERPGWYTYQILGGLAFPLSLLVKGGEVIWEFKPIAQGTQVDWLYEFELTHPFAYFPTFAILRLFMEKAMWLCLKRLENKISPSL